MSVFFRYSPVETKNLRAELYRLRAVELRAMAEMMTTDNRERLLRIADDYEQMADQVERLNLGNVPESPKPNSAL